MSTVGDILRTVGHVQYHAEYRDTWEDIISTSTVRDVQYHGGNHQMLCTGGMFDISYNINFLFRRYFTYLKRGVKFI